MADNKKRQILDLGDLDGRERSYITLSGKDYDLIALDELGLQMQSRIRRWYADVVRLQERIEADDDDLDERDSKLLSDRLRDMCSVVVKGLAEPDCPRHGLDTTGNDGERCSCEILGRVMTDTHTLAVVVGFGQATGLSPATVQPQNRAARRQSRPTTARSGPRSSGSTAGDPKIG